MIIGGSSAAGAGVGGLIGGKKGALIGAAIGGGASALLQTTDRFTLGVGMQSYIDQKYSEHWGPFAAGVLLTSVPVVILFTFLQRFIVGGLTQGSVKG